MIVFTDISIGFKLEVLLGISDELGTAKLRVIGLSNAKFLAGAAGVVRAETQVLLRVELKRRDMEGINLQI